MEPRPCPNPSTRSPQITGSSQPTSQAHQNPSSSNGCGGAPPWSRHHGSATQQRAFGFEMWLPFQKMDIDLSWPCGKKTSGKHFPEGTVDVSTWSSGIDVDSLHSMSHFTCIISSKLGKSDDDTVFGRWGHKSGLQVKFWLAPRSMIILFSFMFLTFYFKIISDLKKLARIVQKICTCPLPSTQISQMLTFYHTGCSMSVYLFIIFFLNYVRRSCSYNVSFSLILSLSLFFFLYFFWQGSN